MFYSFHSANPRDYSRSSCLRQSPGWLALICLLQVSEQQHKYIMRLIWSGLVIDHKSHLLLYPSRWREEKGEKVERERERESLLCRFILSRSKGENDDQQQAVVLCCVSNESLARMDEETTNGSRTVWMANWRESKVEKERNLAGRQRTINLMSSRHVYISFSFSLSFRTAALLWLACFLSLFIFNFEPTLRNGHYYYLPPASQLKRACFRWKRKVEQQQRPWQ